MNLNFKKNELKMKDKRAKKQNNTTIPTAEKCYSGELVVGDVKKTKCNMQYCNITSVCGTSLCSRLL